jgi:hypothetical protein
MFLLLPSPPFPSLQGDHAHKRLFVYLARHLNSLPDSVDEARTEANALSMELVLQVYALIMPSLRARHTERERERKREQREREIVIVLHASPENRQ